MSHCQSRSRKRKFVGSVEILDDRLVLNAGAPVPATPPPAASPFSVAQVRRFERALERIDHGFLAKSKHLESFVVHRTDYLKSVSARIAARAQVQVLNVSGASNMSSSVGLATHAQSLNNQLDRVVASFSTQVTQLSNAFEQEFGVLANPLAESSLRLGVPATAIENNFQRARAGFTSAVNTLTTAVQSQTAAATSQVSTASKSSTPATTAATTTSATTGIGVIATQTFSNASTQAVSGMDTAINSVNATLEQAFSAFQTQFGTNITTLVSALTNAPAASLQPTVGFVSGNGVTFTST
jgi:hypothetical protein